MPARTTQTPRHISIDTEAMLCLLYTGGDKQTLLNNIASPQSRNIWYDLFKIKSVPDDATNEQKQFGYSISTDGFAISILFTTVGHQLNKNQNSENRKRARAVATAENAGKTEAERDEQRAEKELQKQRTKNQKKSEKKIAQRLYAQNAPRPRKTIDGIPYAADMTTEERNETVGKVCVGIDPGKRDLLYMVGDIDPSTGRRRCLSYSNGEHLHVSGRIRQSERSAGQDQDKPPQIRNAEAHFVGNKKATSLDDIRAYMNEWGDLNTLSSVYYSTMKRRRVKFYMYAGRRRAYSKLVNKIRTFWGNEAILYLGDWSDRNLRGFISTPGKSIRRLLKSNFTVFMVDEHKTSKIHHETMTETAGNLRVGDRVLHSVLTRWQIDPTLPGEPNRTLCCFNRDMNAGKNILLLGKLGRDGLPRPAEFRRA
jgi:hypothetical protein